MQVEFLKPVTIETRLMVKGWIKDRVSRRKAVMAASISDLEGTVLARAEGEFAIFQPDSPVLQRILPKEAARDMPRIAPNGPDASD
jgi:acyl-CoA thioesterase FadM